jgi:heme/copper-type cytochrome/quinol oxidase subunit 4
MADCPADGLVDLPKVTYGIVTVVVVVVGPLWTMHTP